MRDVTGAAVATPRTGVVPLDADPERPWLLFVASEFPFPARNGITAKAVNLLRRLASHYRVVLVSFHPAGNPPTATARTEAELVCEEVEVMEAQARNTIGALVRLEPPFVSRFRTSGAMRLLAEVAARRRYAVLHMDTVGPVPLLPAAEACADLTVASINDAYALMLRDRPVGDVLERFAVAVAYRLVGRLERRWYPRFDQIHVVSRVDREFLHDLVPEARVHVVPCGVDAERFRGFEDLEEPNTLVYCAEMAGAHGGTIVRFTEQVMPRIWNASPDTRLLVVGRNPPSALRELAAREPRIEVTGEVPDVRPHVARGTCTLAINPLFGGIHTKVLEAMALARPVIGYARNFVSLEGAEAGRHFVPAETPEALCEGVVSLMADPQRRQALGLAGREFVTEHYPWAQVEHAYLAALRAASIPDSGRRSPAAAARHGG